MKPVFLYKAVFVLFSLSILGGCAVHQVDSGPSPDIAVKLEGYSSLQNNDILPLKAEQGEWWREFKNPELSKLISKALVSNQDLAQAVAKVKQAQALAVTTRGDIAPEVSLEASSSGEARRGHLQRGSSSAGAALNWELDFLGE